MTFLFGDSFDHYSSITQMGYKWTAVGNNHSFTTGRNGNCVAFQNTSYARKTLQGNYATLCQGFAHKVNIISQGPLAIFMDNTSYQVEARFTSDGRIQLTRNGTVLATSTNSIVTNVWYHIQFKATIDPTNGYAEVRVNGATWVSYAGNTRSTSNSYANNVQVMAQSWTTYIDDYYVSTDFMGDLKAECRFPTGAGDNTGWTPNTGTNWDAVNDTSPDDDSTYISTTTVGARDDYEFQDLATTLGTVVAVQRVVDARKDDAGVRTIAPYSRTGGVNYDGANVNVGSSYMYYLDVLELDPATGLPFTISGFNAYKHGVKMVA